LSLERFLRALTRSDRRYAGSLIVNEGNLAILRSRHQAVPWLAGLSGSVSF
jgi:hypothetical protein